MLSGAEDRLASLVANAMELVECGYYSDTRASGKRERPSMAAALRDPSDYPIVAEVKLASPTGGRLSAHLAEELIEDFRLGGAAALSVLTEPRYFRGSLRYLEMAVRTGLPVLMKDFVVDDRQVEAAARAGASAVLLIEGAFDRGMASGRDGLISHAHGLGLEVVLETSDLQEFEAARASEADILAYNRRDLRTFRPGPDLLEEALGALRADGRPSLAMSLMASAEDVRRARDLGASGVLVGSALSTAPCPRDRLRALRVGR